MDGGDATMKYKCTYKEGGEAKYRINVNGTIKPICKQYKDSWSSIEGERGYSQKRKVALHYRKQNPINIKLTKLWTKKR